MLSNAVRPPNVSTKWLGSGIVVSKWPSRPASSSGCGDFPGKRADRPNADAYEKTKCSAFRRSRAHAGFCQNPVLVVLALLYPCLGSFSQQQHMNDGFPIPEPGRHRQRGELATANNTLDGKSGKADPSGSIGCGCHLITYKHSL